MSNQGPNDAGKLLSATDEAATMLNAMEPEAVRTLFQFDFDNAHRMRRTMVGYHANTDEFTTAMANQFTGDVKRIDDAAVDGLTGQNGVIAIDFIPKKTTYADETFSSGVWNNAKGSVREIRVGAARLDNGKQLDSIGKEFETISKNELEEVGALDDVIESVPFPGDMARWEKEEIISDALISSGTSGGMTELDLLTNGRYIEAKHKPGSPVTYIDVRDKFIRYRSLQELGVIDDGSMVLRVSAETKRVQSNIIERFDDVQRFEFPGKDPKNRKSITPNSDLDRTTKEIVPMAKSHNNIVNSRYHNTKAMITQERI